MTLLSLFVMELGGHYGGHVFPHRNILLGILSCILMASGIWMVIHARNETRIRAAQQRQEQEDMLRRLERSQRRLRESGQMLGRILQRTASDLRRVRAQLTRPIPRLRLNDDGSISEY